MIVYGVTEKGEYRAENQDAILIRQSGASGLFIVADGIGGAFNGAAASRYIVDSYSRWWELVYLKRRTAGFQALFEEIKGLAERINQEICQTYGMGVSGSTIVLLFIDRGIYGYLSSGDSRIYSSDRRGTRLLTRDDVWENLPDADVTSTHTGKIISAMGIYEELEYSCATGRVHKRDLFLLCSDGIYRYVEEGYLMKHLQNSRNSLVFGRKFMEEMIGRVIENDTKDNYSAILLRM